MEQQLSLFDVRDVYKPLASRMRPERLEDFAGQKQLLGERGVLRRMIEEDRIPSMIFWGPPGVGKTTLAGIIAGRTHARFINFSAVTSGIKEIKEVMAQAEGNRRMGEKTVVFVDEIHRFNKAQQDAFLPYVEKGSIILIGATTENPSFEINNALLSRCRVFVLERLSAEDICQLLKRALKSPEGLGYLKVEITDEMLEMIAQFADGDARRGFNLLEMAVTNGQIEGDRSMRNSDPDAAVYWLARMLEAGEDPLYIARRLIRFASEDVAMADNQALPLAVAAYQACHFLGMPECNVNLSHAVIYLSMAPKSNTAYVAYEEAKKDAQDMLAEPVPLNIRNAPTGLMKELHYGEGYVYAHDTKEKLARMQCLPESLTGRTYYRPTEEGQEKHTKKRLEEIRRWKENQE